MKKNILQKLIVLLAAGALGLMLVACGDKSSAGNPGLDVDPGNGAAGIEGWTAFDENVTLTVPVYDRGAEGVPTVTDNYWTKWIQENFGDKYNITVKFSSIPRSDVMTQYSLLSTSHDLPTILMEYDYDKLAKWAEDGYLSEYDVDAFAQVAPTYYQRMVDQDQTTYIPLNGKNYFALAYRPYYNTSYTYVNFVRMDWLKQVGYDHIPATRAEYLDAMKKIMDKGISAHPGGGSMLLSGQGADQNHGYRTFPLNEEEWAMYGDYNIPSLGWEPNKLLLKYANADYNAGITDPEYYTIDTATAEANFINGKNYQWGGYISASMPVLESFYKENPNAELAVSIQSLEPDTEAGTTPSYRADNPFGMMIGFSSQATADQIKAAWMYMEWMTQEDVLFTMQWGIEGQNFNYVDGTPESVAYDQQPIDYKQGYNNNKDYWCVTIEARNASTIEETIAMSSPKGLPQDFTQDLIKNYYNKVEAAEKGWAISDCAFGKSIESAGEYQVQLQSLYVELRDKLVTCPVDQFDSLYEQYTKQYMEAGYQEVVDERKAVYEEGLTTKLPQ